MANNMMAAATAFFLLGGAAGVVGGIKEKPLLIAAGLFVYIPAFLFWLGALICQ